MNNKTMFAVVAGVALAANVTDAKAIIVTQALSTGDVEAIAAFEYDQLPGMAMAEAAEIFDGWNIRLEVDAARTTATIEVIHTSAAFAPNPGATFSVAYAIPAVDIPAWVTVGTSNHNGVDATDGVDVISLKFDENATPTLLNPSFSPIDSFQVKATHVPEPHEYALMAGLGLVGFAGYRRFRRA